MVTTSAVIPQNAEKLREAISRCCENFGCKAIIKLAHQGELIRKGIFGCSTALSKELKFLLGR